jgi:hypothetical protein
MNNAQLGSRGHDGRQRMAMANVETHRTTCTQHLAYQRPTLMIQQIADSGQVVRHNVQMHGKRRQKRCRVRRSGCCPFGTQPNHPCIDCSRLEGTSCSLCKRPRMAYSTDGPVPPSSTREYREKCRENSRLFRRKVRRQIFLSLKLGYVTTLGYHG